MGTDCFGVLSLEFYFLSLGVTLLNPLYITCWELSLLTPHQ